MKKVIFGVTFLVVLVALMIGKTVMDNQTEATSDNLYDVTGDTSVTGGMIAPAESVGIQPGEAAPDFEL